ncbi:MAG TPA: DUF4062 domain-containing protein [Trebonia sp.]
MRVFVSSTYHDLLSYRAAATRAIITTGNLTEDMLYWAASETPPADESLRRLRSSQLVILLIAHRYGTVRPPASKSVTELEIDEALNRRIPILAFTVDPAHPWPPDQIDTDPAARELLAQFTRKVRDQVTVNTFSSPESLELAITRALAVYVNRHRGSDLPPYARERMVEVSRPESLRFAPDAIIQIGRAPDGAPLLLLVHRSISFEKELDGIAAKLRRHPGAPIVDDIRSQLSQAAAALAATRGVHEGEIDGKDATFYIPGETLTELMPPSLFPLILARMRIGRSVYSARPDITHPADIRLPVVRNSGPVQEVVARYSSPNRNVFRDSVPSIDPPTFPNPRLLGVPDPDDELPVFPVPIPDPFAPTTTVVAEAERVFSYAGRNRFLCVSLDTTPVAWSGGWSGGWGSRPAGSPRLVIGRRFIEEGLERLHGVRYVLEAPDPTGVLMDTTLQEPFRRKRAQLLAALDEYSLGRLSHRVIVPRSAVMDFVLEVVDEAAGLHARGRVHGDIKPNNILLGRGDVTLIDNGDLSVGDVSPTVTLDWSPAEQLLLQPVSFTADVYCLGLLLLHVLDAGLLGREATYRLPGGEVARVLDNPVVYISPDNDTVPEATRRPWCDLIEKALRTDPGERWASAREMGDAMRVILKVANLSGSVEVAEPLRYESALIEGEDGDLLAAWVIAGKNAWKSTGDAPVVTFTPSS